MQAKLLFLHALSPLHVGTGQGVGVIDLPVAREKPTGIPIVPGSTLKGVLRAQVTDEDVRKRIFGPDTRAAYEHAGSVQFGDLHLLFLPVRSLRGTFAWVTSPFLLRRFRRDARWTDANLSLPDVPEVSSTEGCLVPEGSALLLEKVILEDLDLTAQPDAGIKTWAETLAPHIFGEDQGWKQTFIQRVCLVHDDVLTFLLDTALEVRVRIRLKEETKTVDRESGALWYEEALPAETVMAGIVVIEPVRAEPNEIIQKLRQIIQEPVQLGGNATVGRGLCWLTLV